MTLAGLVASGQTWATLEQQWEQILRERYPIAPYVHMTDLITRNDPFERVAGWSECKVDRLVDDAERLLGSVDKKKICAFACSIDIAARKRLIAEGYQISDPAIICAEIGLGSLIKWYQETHKVELAQLFYDRSEPFIRSIEHRWRIHEQKLVADPFWGMITSVCSVAMNNTAGIQAADMVAWAVSRRLRNAPGDKWANNANRLIGTRTYSGILTATQLDPIDESIMRRKHSKQ